MNLIGFRHKGLKRLYKQDDARSVPAQSSEKLRKLLFVLETADTIDQVSRFPGWKLHPLKGELEGFWSISVTGNRRLIFHYDERTNSAGSIDLVDYH